MPTYFPFRKGLQKLYFPIINSFALLSGRFLIRFTCDNPNTAFFLPPYLTLTPPTNHHTVKIQNIKLPKQKEYFRYIPMEDKRQYYADNNDASRSQITIKQKFIVSAINKS